MVKIPWFHFRGHRFDPWWETKILYAVWYGQVHPPKTKNTTPPKNPISLQVQKEAERYWELESMGLLAADSAVPRNSILNWQRAKLRIN